MSDFDKQLKDLEKAIKTGEVSSTPFKPNADGYNYSAQNAFSLSRLILLLFCGLVAFVVAAKFWPKATLTYVPKAIQPTLVQYLDIKEVPVAGAPAAGASSDAAALPGTAAGSNVATTRPVSPADFKDGQTYLPNGLEESKDYVRIRGAYYKRQPNHIYNVNGERVFFNDGRN